MLRKLRSLISGKFNHNCDYNFPRNRQASSSFGSTRGRFESLEDRRMLASDFAGFLHNPTPGPVADYHFGNAIAINNNGLIVVGEARADDSTPTNGHSGDDQGAVYVYDAITNTPVSFDNPNNFTPPC